MDYKDLAKKWFEKGNNDLKAGEYILTMPNPPTDTICFHSQQAVEKYLKGFLAFHGKETPKIHDLQLKSGIRWRAITRLPMKRHKRLLKSQRNLKNSF